MQDIVLLGAGGQAKDMLKNIEEYNADQLSRQKRFNVLGCFDDVNKVKPGDSLMGYSILPSIKCFERKPFRNARAICAIGDPVGKKVVVEKIRRYKVKFFNLIHPSIKIHPTVKLGTGVSIFYCSVISAICNIGDHVSINYLCSMSHDCYLGSYATFAPGVKIAGGGRLGEGVFMGINSCTIHNINIGRWSIIGAGTAVIKDIPSNVIVAGNPPKELGKRDMRYRVF